MRSLLSLTVVLLGGLCPAAAMDDPANTAATGQTPASKSEPTADETAIRAASAAFVKAFNASDAQAIADLFTEDVESIDEDGTVVKGKRAVADLFAQAFSASPGSKMEIRTDSIRFLSPEVAKEEGRSTIKPAGAGAPDVDRYSVLYVKRDGKWLQSSIREHPEQDLSPHERLKELEWMLGEWVDESDSAVIFTTCRWSEDQNFLLRHYAIHVEGKPALNGTQRIGWDPVTGQFKSWVFDSKGGYSEGLWSREGNRWVVKVSGPLRDGKITTETNIITKVRDGMARWQSVDRTVAGRVLPDSREFVLVRRPPQPEQ
jgi:uncharacterized protein (TIGR02246 family)